MSTRRDVAVVSREEEDFLAFEREFRKNVDELAVALADSRAAGSDASTIRNKGTWAAVWGAVNGDSDKELAETTGKLARSLTVTQTVLQMVMKISHRKNGFLKQFHEVLVGKISSLTQDTRTLDSNQRDATMAILEEIEHHVAGQLAHHDTVERQQARLDSIDRYIETADLQSFKVEQQLVLLAAAADSLGAAHAGLERGVGAHEARIAALESALDTGHALVDEQRALIERLQGSNDALVRQADAMSKHGLEQAARIDRLEAAMRASGGIRAMLLRHAPALAAVLLAALALMRTGVLAPA